MLCTATVPKRLPAAPSQRMTSAARSLGTQSPTNVGFGAMVGVGSGVGDGVGVGEGDSDGETVGDGEAVGAPPMSPVLENHAPSATAATANTAAAASSEIRPDRREDDRAYKRASLMSRLRASGGSARSNRWGSRAPRRASRSRPSIAGLQGGPPGTQGGVQPGLHRSA